MASKEWTVRLPIDEQGDLTRASAILTGEEGVLVRAEGRSRRNPSDPRALWIEDELAASIGDELAVSRSLHALADRLTDIAARDIDLVARHG
jgi:hypothetical protein